MKLSTNNIWSGSLFLLTLLYSSCTDLEVDEKDSLVTQVAEFKGVDAAATIESAYADLRKFSNQEDIYALLEVTSDELLVPTRGTDWGDNGIWRSLHQHTWDDQHRYITSSWNSLNSSIFKINQVLAPQTTTTAAQRAEGKFLRAFNMWYVLDLYRQVPYRGATEGVEVDPIVLTVQQALDTIINDLTAAVEGLPVTPAMNEKTNRASKAAANFMLAKVYLNKHVYLDQQPNAADMTKVIQCVDAITADGYSLHEGFFDIFKDFKNKETILWTNESWGNRIWNTLHYKQVVPSNTGGGWNGFSTTADFYALFEGDPNSNYLGANQEERRGFVVNTKNTELHGIGYGFLVGQQYDAEGKPLTDRSGNPLIFTKEFADPSLTGNSERNGIRVIKYHPRHGSFNGYYILARYADAYLMKIEAMLRGGTASGGATATNLYNNLREIRQASTVTNVTLKDILDERGRELYIEGWRRNDLIRFDLFTKRFAFKEVEEEHRKVFPIPATAISTNPNLKPNPGY